MKRPVPLLLILVVLSACTSPEATREEQPEASEHGQPTGPAWQAPAEYSFRVRSTCGERNFLGRFDITVRGDRVIRVTALDEPAKRSLSALSRRDLPTLEDLLAEATDARLAGADQVEIRSDKVGGYPTHIEIDYNKQAVDDEACYSISRYRQL